MDTDQVKKIAHLARINVSDQDLDAIKGDLERIIEYVKALEELDVDAIEASYAQKNIVRLDDDAIDSGTYTQRILDNAPNTKDGYVQVSKIL